jgi:hypothetical protein
MMQYRRGKGTTGTSLPAAAGQAEYVMRPPGCRYQSTCSKDTSYHTELTPSPCPRIQVHSQNLSCLLLMILLVGSLGPKPLALDLLESVENVRAHSIWIGKVIIFSIRSRCQMDGLQSADPQYLCSGSQMA